MKVDEGTLVDSAARRHIIRRPRLTRMLDESSARIILLVAPAGYGKTTLAREWLDNPSRRSAWHRGGPASADVAAFSVGLARAANEIVPGAGCRMEERLKATNRPDEEAVLLAEMLAEDLRDWPSDAWLVLDDYQFAIAGNACESFAETLSHEPNVQILLTSRRRPAWASAKRRLYGEVSEIDRTVLALTDDEAVAVLASADEDVAGLVVRAQGWPAVIGMAALTGEFGVPDDRLPSTLYDYFAEELYQGLPPKLRWALCQLAIAPRIDPGLASRLFGSRATKVLEDAVRLGAAARSDGETVELHPLLRNFLETKLDDFPASDVLNTVYTVGGHLTDHARWDDVFDLVERFNVIPLLVELAEAGLEHVLSKGRTATVSRWVEFAADRLVSGPIFDLAEAELAFREGLMRKTEALALKAASGFAHGSKWVAVARTRAGRAAHMGGRAKDAIGHHSAALANDPVIPVRREALWGSFVSLIDVEEVETARRVLVELEAAGADDVDDLLRIASGQYLLSVRGGTGASADDLLRAAHLIDRSNDPLTRSSFLNSCAGALVLEARYDEADTIARRQLDEAETYRLRFVLPYGLLQLAAAQTGRRAFAEAHELLEQAERLALDTGHPWIDDALRTARSLLLISMGQPLEGSVVSSEQPSSFSASLRGEMMAVRALGLACAGAAAEAKTAISDAQRISSTLEIKSIAAIIDAILTKPSDEASLSAFKAFDFVVKHGTVDHFVTAYRSCPNLLAAVVARSDPRLAPILAGARDHQLARKFGLMVPIEQDRTGLSPRETEVLAMLSQGLTNKAIARALYISESTVKVHVRHIMEKVGARTRTEAVAKGRSLLRRSLTPPAQNARAR